MTEQDKQQTDRRRQAVTKNSDVEETTPALVSVQGQASNPITEWRVSTDVILERVSTDPYELSYACLLIPRFRNHHLVGDLTDDLHKLMPKICLSFGWKLDYLAIRPEYLQWILRVQPVASPGTFMHILRRETSKEIMLNFPLIKQENLSRDFWAPGYLVIVGREPHPPQMVNEFIRLTRQQQDFQPRRGD